MDWISITVLVIANILLLLYVHDRARRRGYREGLSSAVRIALRHMNKQQKASRSVHEVILLIEEERDGYTKEQS